MTRRKVLPVLRDGGKSAAAFRWYLTVPRCKCGKKYLITYERRKAGMCLSCERET